MTIPIIDIILLIIGLAILVKSADIFVGGASNIAYNYRIPTVIVGLTIVAFGTSAPEAAMSLTKTYSHQFADAIGTVVGSNIFNILGVIGVSALYGTLTVDKDVIKRDLPFLLRKQKKIGRRCQKKLKWNFLLKKQYYTPLLV